MNSSLTPKVSVCIPVYNGSDYIAKSIESVLAQTYKDFQLIVVDNCSTDNTEEIIRNFHDPRLTYIKNKQNIGLVGNENRCLELSKGDYIYIFHHDDIMLPDNLELKVNLLDEHPQVGFVHSNILLIDEKGEVVADNIWYEYSRRDYIKKGREIFDKCLAYLHFGASIFIGSVLARRKCYENVGKFSPELPHCHDSEMWMRMSLFYDVACIGTPLVKYRVHQNTASSDWGSESTVPYVTEHYLAAMMIFNKYNNLILEAHKLKKRVSLSFANRSIKLAKTAIVNGDYSTAKSFVKEAIRMSPWILKNPFFWVVAGGVSIGPNGFRFYKSIKKVFGNRNT
jgi:glycosyltransferase involved in cell wall biosynthesis